MALPPVNSLDGLASLVPPEVPQQQTPIGNPLDSLALLVPKEDPIPQAVRNIGAPKSIPKKQLFEDALDTTYPENVVRDPVNYLNQYRALDTVDIAGMAPSTQSAAAKFFHHLSQKGYKPVIESGRRYKGGRSYHDHGEALDINIYDGKGNYLSPSLFGEVKQLAAETGFRGIINETDAKVRAQTGGTGPHIHLAMGPESNFGPDLATLRKGKTASRRPGYIAKQPKPGDNSVSEDYVHSIARAQGWDDPNDLVRQLKAESGLRSRDADGNVLASKDANGNGIAFGIAQFTPATLEAVGPRYGISPEEYYKNPAAQVRLGSLYMLDLIKKNGGSKSRALFEYNAGGPQLQDFLAGKAFMPEETRNYISKVLRVDPNQVDTMVATGKGDKIFSPTKHQQRFEEDKRTVQEQATDFLKLWGKNIKDNYWDQGHITSPDQVDMFKEALEGVTFGLSDLFGGKPSGSFDALRSGASLPERMALGLPWFLGNVLTTEFIAGKLGATTMFTKPGETLSPLGTKVSSALDWTKHLVPEAGTKGMLPPIARLFMGTTPEYAKSILTYAGITGVNVATESAVKRIEKGDSIRDSIPGILADGLGGAAMGAFFGFGVPAAIGGTALMAGEMGIAAGQAGPITQGIMHKLYGPTEDGIQKAAQYGHRLVAGAIPGMLGTEFVNEVTGSDVPVWEGAAGGAALTSLGPKLLPLIKNGMGFESQEAAHAAAGSEAGAAGHVLDGLHPAARKGLTGVLTKWWNGLKEYNKQIIEGSVTDHLGKYFKATRAQQRERTYQFALQSGQEALANVTEIGSQQSRMFSAASGEIQQVRKYQSDLQNELSSIPGGAHYLENKAQLAKMQEDVMSGKVQKEQQAMYDYGIKQLQSAQKTQEQSWVTAHKAKPFNIPGDTDPLTHVNQIESRLAEASKKEAQWKAQWGENGEQLTKLKGDLDSQMSLARYHQELMDYFQQPEVKDDFFKMDFKRLADDAEYRASIAERMQSHMSALPDHVLQGVADSPHNQEYLKNFKESVINKVTRSLAGEPIYAKEIEQKITQGMRTLYDPQAYLARFLEEQKDRLDSAVKAIGPEGFLWSHEMPKEAVIRTNWENRDNILNRGDKKIIHTDPAVLSNHLKVVPETVGVTAPEMEAKVTELLGKAEAGETLKFPRLVLKDGRLTFRKPQNGVIDDAYRDQILSIEVAKRMGDTAIPIKLQNKPGVLETAKKQLQETWKATEYNAASEAALQYRLTNEYLKTLREGAVPSVPGIMRGDDDVFDVSQPAIVKRLLRNNLQLDKDGLLVPTTETGKMIAQKLSAKGVPLDRDVLEKEVTAAMNNLPTFNGFQETYDLLRNTMKPKDFDKLFQDEIGRIGTLLADKDSPAALLGRLLSDDPTDIMKQATRTGANLRDLINQADHGIMTLAHREVQRLIADGGMNWKNVFGYAKNMIPALLMNRKQAVGVMAAGVADRFRQFNLTPEQLTTVKNILDDPRRMMKGIQDPQIKAALGYYMDILGLIQKQEAHRPELIPAAERIYLLKKYPGLSHFAQRKEGQYLSHSDVIDRLGVYTKDAQSLFDKFLDWGPLRYDDLKGTLGRGKKVKRLFAPFAADNIHEAQNASARERARTEPKDIEELAKRVKQGILQSEKGAVDKFMALDPEDPTHYGALSKLTSMEEAFRENPTKAIDRWKDMQVLLMMETGEKDVGTLLSHRLSSVFDAHSEQDMLRNFSQLMISGKAGANENPQYALEVRENGTPPQTYARYSGKKTKVSKPGVKGFIEGFVSPTYDTEAVRYQPLSMVFGDKYAYIDGTGKAIPAGNVYLHPDLVHFLDSYAIVKPDRKASTETWEKLRDLVRHFALVGGPMPHALNTASNVMLNHAMNPLRAFGLMSKGKALMDHEDRYFLMANAVRHGLNPKVGHAMTQAIADQFLDKADPEMRAHLLQGNTMQKVTPQELTDKTRETYSPPYPESTWLKFMKAMDVGEDAAQARKGLPAAGKLFSDFFGFAPKVDAMMARAIIVEPMQQAQLAAFYNHSVEIFQRASMGNPGISKEMLWKQSQEAASIKVNQLSGALPYYFTSTKWRNMANTWLLTPNWAMGKAQAILGALEPVMGLVDKSLTRNTMFGHLAEPVRRDLYQQYASALTVGTLSFVGATQMMNFLMNGKMSLDSENSKDWFRVKVGDHVYNNPLFGFYREFARSVGGTVGEDSIAPILENFARQLLPGASGLAASATGATSSMQPSGVTGQLGNIKDNVLDQAASTEEVFGGGSLSKIDEIFGIKIADSMKEGKVVPAARMRGKEWALRLMGVYRSDYNTPIHIERKYQEEQLYWMNYTKDQVSDLIQAGLDSNDPEKTREFIGRAFNKGVLQGVKTGGKFADFQSQKTGSPYLTMSFDQFMNILTRKSSPVLYGVEVMGKKKGPIVSHMIQELDRVNKSWDEAIREQFDFSPVDVGVQQTQREMALDS